MTFVRLPLVELDWRRHWRAKALVSGTRNRSLGASGALGFAHSGLAITREPKSQGDAGEALGYHVWPFRKPARVRAEQSWAHRDRTRAFGELWSVRETLPSKTISVGAKSVRGGPYRETPNTRSGSFLRTPRVVGVTCKRSRGVSGNALLWPVGVCGLLR
jgi:hypothetical protein